MRKLILVTALLVAVGFVLFWIRSGGAEDSSAPRPGADSGSTQASAPAGRAGTVLQPESPEDVSAKGSADPGSTPALAQAPSEQDGVLEVEVVAGEQPVPGANVRLYWRGPRDPNLNEVSWRLASTGATDARGRARLASRPGSYLVAVRAQGYAPLRRDVVRPYGEARTLLRLTLVPGQGLTGRTVEQGSALEGRMVARGTGAPIAGASLDVSPHDSNGDSGRAVTDATGRFSVEGLAPGSYDLVASAPGFSPLSRRALTVAAGERFPVELQLQGSGAVEGHVRASAGQPVPGAQILGGERWAGSVISAPAEARTDAEGHYRLEGLPVGPQSLTARREGATLGVAHPVSITEGVTRPAPPDVTGPRGSPACQAPRRCAAGCCTRW
ncbi:MAG: carboxypeptidase regulatory-like domain-containing protein [Hyalangium sp.]|uniref:carboxypeptidase regulatory-like domain-containing protein n=1 Tax=Hyalangium sp. TaxID=2028555 RepID=UPI00389ACC8E